jgi:hypothetical protein
MLTFCVKSNQTINFVVVLHLEQFLVGEVSGSYGGEYEDDNLVECGVV